jgi:hypothetical protein
VERNTHAGRVAVAVPHARRLHVDRRGDGAGRRECGRSPAARSSGVGGGARGGTTTASARGNGEPGEVRPGPLTQARADCWMKVETQKGLRSIDQRSAFVDKCVAEQLKSKPSP